MNKNSTTLTIGIPAYNEEKNIANLLDSILAQERTNYKLTKIIVVFDGNDRTGKIVKKYTKQYKFIKLFIRNNRKGKADALNLIYSKSVTDFLLTIDADVIFSSKKDISNMMTVILKNNKINMVGPRHIPVKPTSLMGKFAYISYRSFEDAFMNINKGNNFYAVMNAELMRKRFYKSFKFPINTISDQIYVTAQAFRNNKKGFKLVNNSFVFFKTVDTFHDWRILGVRSVLMDKQNGIELAGKEILDLYSMPKRLYFSSLLKWFFKSPFYTFGAVFMNMYIRKFPYKKAMPKNGMWQLTESSKSLAL